MNIDDRAEQQAEMEGVLAPLARPMVEAIDTHDLPNDTKHSMIYSALLAAVPFLKGSVKEVRGIPDEVIATAIDDVIVGAVSFFRGGLSDHRS